MHSTLDRRPSHCCTRQSAYRQGHSTETALLDVLDSVHTAADNKEVTLFIGLDLFAAFDTVYHSTFTKRQQKEFGSVCDCTILDSVISTGPDTGQHQSSETTVEVGVPPGSVFVHLLCAVYCITAADIIASHGVRCHQYPMTLSST